MGREGRWRGGNKREGKEMKQKKGMGKEGRKGSKGKRKKGREGRVNDRRKGNGRGGNVKGKKEREEPILQRLGVAAYGFWCHAARQKPPKYANLTKF